ncbi:DUF6494 family protein [Ferrimonas marina]|uniref:Uncharacterized protein n=1 Tax=Ferrimonas marina TaxID=299255 RepID=A0A1M5XBX4_9GAMM|nr:DUF6494 family protein [Ferrimonas marina]SHH96693.1 hypothetical protein SAMN02745129_3375 [Ferrimonas marina]
MDQEQRNNAIRRFLKQVGIQSHQELDQLLADAEKAGTLGGEPVKVVMTLSVPSLDFEHRIAGELSKE